MSATTERTLLDDVKDEFVRLCLGERMDPVDAAEELQIPYELLCAAKDATGEDGNLKHPELAHIFRLVAETGLVPARRRKQRNTLDIKVKLAQGLEEAGFYSNIVKWAKMAKPSTDENKNKTAMAVMKMLLQYGVLRDTLPKEQMAQIEHISSKDELEQMPLAKLVAMVASNTKRLEVLAENQEKAQVARKKAMLTMTEGKVSDAEYEHSS
jgi:hypothetical protein